MKRAEKVRVRVTINGEKIDIYCEPSKTLLDLIREDLGLKGTKRGCEIGECGACTIIMDGETVNSCMLLAAQADGSDIITIEGLSDGASLHPIQKSFIEKGAVQCGFCTPGMILSAKALLDKNPEPATEEINYAIAGNICRCTGYKQIVEAIKYASQLIMNHEGLKTKSIGQ